MRIRDIIQEKGARVVTIDADQSIHEAITKLNNHRIGALVATTADGGIAGIITERDILRVCGEIFDRLGNQSTPEDSAYQSLVQSAMTTDVVIGVPDDELNYAMGVMTKNHIRHLPILDDGQLVGIISIGDLVNAHLEEKVFENRTLREYIQGASR